MINAEVEKKIEEMMTVLDNDIQNIEDNLSRLNELRAYIVKHDHESMQKMLERIQSESHSYKENETQRKKLRSEIAMLMNCPLSNITLTKLELILTGEIKFKVAEKKSRLKTITDRLKNEHLSTTILLNECARYNSRLLRSILELGQTRTFTYGPQGDTERQSSSAFMNMQL